MVGKVIAYIWSWLTCGAQVVHQGITAKF